MTITTTSTVGGNVAGWLGRRRVTHRAAAEALGLSAQAFSRRINDRTAWRANELDMLSKLLQVPVADFFDGVTSAEEKAEPETEASA